MFLKEFKFPLKSFLADERKEAIISIVKKWENEFNGKLEYDIANKKVFLFCCIDCKMWDKFDEKL